MVGISINISLYPPKGLQTALVRTAKSPCQGGHWVKTYRCQTLFKHYYHSPALIPKNQIILMTSTNYTQDQTTPSECSRGPVRGPLAACASLCRVHFAALQSGCKYFRSCLSGPSEILSLFTWPHLQAAEGSYENRTSARLAMCAIHSKTRLFCFKCGAHDDNRRQKSPKQRLKGRGREGDDVSID